MKQLNYKQHLKLKLIQKTKQKQKLEINLRKQKLETKIRNKKLETKIFGSK